MTPPLSGLAGVIEAHCSSPAQKRKLAETQIQFETKLRKLERERAKLMLAAGGVSSANPSQQTLKDFSAEDAAASPRLQDGVRPRHMASVGIATDRPRSDDVAPGLERST